MELDWLTSPRSGDYDSSYPVEVRKYIHTYGLTPPNVETYEIQAKRCEIGRSYAINRAVADHF